MMSEKNPASPPDGSISPGELFVMLLNQINTWKKLFIAAFMLTFLGVGYFAWENRITLSYAMFSYFDQPRINEQKLDAEAIRLLAETGGVGISVWSVNPDINQRTLLYFRIREQRVRNLEGMSDIYLRPYSELTPHLIITADEKSSCFKLIVANQVGRKIRDAGINYVCAAAIPPKFALVAGLLMVGFTEPPENEDYVKLRIKSMAEGVTQ